MARSKSNRECKTLKTGSPKMSLLKVEKKCTKNSSPMKLRTRTKTSPTIMKNEKELISPMRAGPSSKKIENNGSLENDVAVKTPKVTTRKLKKGIEATPSVKSAATSTSEMIKNSESPEKKVSVKTPEVMTSKSTKVINQGKASPPKAKEASKKKSLGFTKKTEAASSPGPSSGKKRKITSSGKRASSTPRVKKFKGYGKDFPPILPSTMVPKVPTICDWEPTTERGKQCPKITPADVKRAMNSHKGSLNWIKFKKRDFTSNTMYKRHASALEDIEIFTPEEEAEWRRNNPELYRTDRLPPGEKYKDVFIDFPNFYDDDDGKIKKKKSTGKKTGGPKAGCSSSST